MKKENPLCISILFCCLLFAPKPTFSQQINAGMVSLADMYTDLNPDSILITGYSISLSLPCCGVINIDIDQDGVDDLKFDVIAYGGLGAGSSICKVVSLDPNVSIISRADTCYTTGLGQLVTDVPVNFSYSDLIDSSSGYLSDTSYIWFESYGGDVSHSPFVDDWFGIYNHYVGVVKVTNSDTLYGWIQISVSNVGPFQLSVMDFAINQSVVNGYSSANHQKYPLLIYPNPLKGNQLNIKYNQENSPAKVLVYNIYGEKVFEDRGIFKGSIKINTSNITSGVYFIKLEVGNEVMVEKFIKE